jgi:hypothetical protein
MLSVKHDVSKALLFFKMMMRADHRRLPFSISVDKNAAYPEAFSTSQAERIVPKDCKLRRVKYLNNVIEQDHRFIKKKVRASQCFKRFNTAERTLEGIEAINMMRKAQVKRLAGSDAQGQAKFVETLFGIAAGGKTDCNFLRFKIILATLLPAMIRAAIVASAQPQTSNASVNRAGRLRGARSGRSVATPPAEHTASRKGAETPWTAWKRERGLSSKDGAWKGVA